MCSFRILDKEVFINLKNQLQQGYSLMINKEEPYFAINNQDIKIVDDDTKTL